MALKDLIPWRKRRGSERVELSRPQDLRDAFEQFMHDWFLSPIRGEREPTAFSPAVDVADRETEYLVKAEMPGMDAEDVDVSIAGDSLSIKGEKRQESRQEAGSYLRVESSYGAFVRTIPLPSPLPTPAIMPTARSPAKDFVIGTKASPMASRSRQGTMVDFLPNLSISIPAG